LSVPTSSHAYGIGLIAVIIGTGVGIVYYQMYFIPEYNAKPHVDPKVADPAQTTKITIVSGSSNQDQQDNFLPKKQPIQLGVNNRVVWTNDDNVAHYVTIDPKSHYNDLYSGPLDSPAIMPGKTFSFVFTQEGTINYYCKVHPWMTGEIDSVHGALTS
jgi:plastocyanin